MISKKQFKQAAIDFQLGVFSIKHLFCFVTYSFDKVCFVESGTTKEHEIAAQIVNAAWDAWLVQQRKLEAKDKLLIQQGQAFNEQSQKVKDLEYKQDINFSSVNTDAVLVIARTQMSMFCSVEHQRSAIRELQLAFKQTGVPIVLLDSGYELEVLTNEQLHDIGLKRIDRGTLQNESSM